MLDLELEKSPNAEQLNAITTLTGMTLSAGAGAGKTFVLVEHLIFRLDDLYNKNFSNKWNENSTKELQAKLLKIVMITFTRKASGELATRIRERVQDKISKIPENNDYLKYWQAVEDNLHLIFVSTIHSFCQRILSQKSVFVPVQEIEIADDVLYRNKIRKLFEEFLAINEKQIELKYLIFTGDVEKAIQKIFQNVESRLSWTNAPDEIEESKLLEELFLEIQHVLAIGEVWDFIPVVTIESKKPKKWMDALVDYNRLCVKYEGLDCWSLQVLEEVYDTFKSFRKATYAEASAEQVAILEKIHTFKSNKNLKNFLESTNAYLNNKEFIHGLYSFIKNAFSYVENHFYRDGLIGFNDLEYLIVRFLNNPEAKKILADQYDVIIVDEYQDTSYTQFKILEIVTNHDFSKIVAVGDLKQAIYGFRGGEVGVFAATKSLVSKNLSLSNNYRSEENIIKFNNEFFDFIFPLGPGFEKGDRFGFIFEPQKYPHTNGVEKNTGKIYRHLVSLESLENTKKPSTFEIKKLEAKLVADKIENIIQKEDIKSIAVLYRKLSGSELLIEELQKRAIKFTAQTKILFSNEPVYLLTRVLLDVLLVDRSRESNVQASFRKLFEILALFEINQSQNDLSVFLDKFTVSYNFWGLRFSLEEAFFNLGVSDSRHSEVWTKILSLIEISEGSLAKFDIALRKLSEEMTSTRLDGFGKGPGVQIMTVHASKGLEFDAVFVAGIHNNGKSPVSRDKIGETFLSLAWKLKKSDRKELKTPWMLLEQLRKKEVEFSESKRLFYVACTRAKKDLHFIDINYFKNSELEGVVFDNNSWVNGLREFFLQNNPHYVTEDIQNIKLGNTISSEVSLDEVADDVIDENSDDGDGFLEEDLTSAPPFHKTNLGIKIHQRHEVLGVVGEMSVTKLSEIVECPRKFYFNSVLKLSDENLFIQKENDGEELSYVPNSTKERGTDLHYKIYHHLNAKLLGKEAVPEVLWVVEEIQKLNMPHAFLEKEIKFSFFGQMISGTPDWYNVNEAKNEVTIIDYKTGTLTDEKSLKYNAQVLIYAFGIKKLNSLPDDSVFKMMLFAIDERRIVEKVLNGKEVSESAYELWSKIYQLNQVRTKHCSHCNFQSYCQEK